MMVGSGMPSPDSASQQVQPQASQLGVNSTGDFNTANSGHPWSQVSSQRRGMIRGSYPPPVQRRMDMYYPPPRFPINPQQYFQMKQRPPWRMPRLPRFPPNSNHENYMNYPRFWNSNNQGSTQATATPSTTEEENAEEAVPKKKRRSTNGTSRPWDREAAEKALALEMECQKSAGTNAIVIRFPDPELSKEIVQNFHNSIENVHFQAPCGARYCFVTLKDDANVEKVMKDINKVKFGVGYLQAEKKVQKVEETVGPENIDPFTLYVGNLPTNISTLEVKEKFPTATRIDVGYAQKMKYTRYAFIRYSTAEAAFEAYKTSVNSIIASRSIILRFRRHKAPVGPPGQKPSPSVLEAKPGEKLTVGAKLKAKKEKAKAEKLAKENELKKIKKLKKIKTEDASSDEEEVELEKDESEFGSGEEDDDDDDDDDEDDDDDPDDDDDDDDDDPDDDMVQYEDDNVDDDDDDDDLDDDIEANVKVEDDDDYASYGYAVNLDQLTENK